MCLCRIKLVLLGLLGLLCVVHVVSGMCGQDFPSTAMVSDVVIQGKVLNVSNTNAQTGLYYAKITLRNPVLKGKKIIKKMGKDAKVLTLGPFKRKPDVENCFGPVKKGKTYIFLLNKGSINQGVKFHLQALPKKRTKKEYKKLRDIICKATNKCKKKKKASKPRIRRIVGPKDTVNTGSKLTFKCYAKANPPPIYSWLKDGVPLNPKKGKLTIKKTKRYSKLQIRRSNAEDVGDYQCRVSNVMGTDERNFSSFAIRHNPKDYRSDTFLCAVQTLCLHGGTCLYNNELHVTYCACKPKWTGTRCEIMDAIRIHGHYSRQATLLYERTLIIVGLVIAVLVFIVICIASYFLAKRKRKKFEAKKKRKQLLRANASNSVRVKDNSTQAYRTEENGPSIYNNTYQPVNNDPRSFFPGRDNGFDFEAAQRQPLLRHHNTDDIDGSGPESRRRLVASSMYDNFDDPTQNRSANVTGMTTAEVTQNSEMIEMSPIENRTVEPVSNALGDKNNNPGRPTTENGHPYSPSEDSSLTFSQQSPESSIHHQPNSSIPQEEIPLHSSLSDLPPPPSEDLDFENYKAPPPPILPISHSNSSPLRHTPNSTAAAASNGDSHRFPSSNSMPSKLVNNVDNNDYNDNKRHLNGNHTSLPYNHNNNNYPYANFETPPETNIDPSQNPLIKSQTDESPPSYDTAVVLMNGIASSSDVDYDSDDVADERFRNNPSNVIEDLHISEDDLGLSAENLPRGSFNSSSHPSRQPSLDMDGTAASDPLERYSRRRRFSVEKQQSEDIIEPGQFLKRSVLYGQSPRSQSLDTPSSVNKINGTGPHNLDSTVSGNQSAAIKYDGARNSSGGKAYHADEVFDPNDNSTPWDPEQSCNANNYSNLLDEESDRLNRMKDVIHDQPAIPI